MDDFNYPCAIVAIRSSLGTFFAQMREDHVPDLYLLMKELGWIRSLRPPKSRFETPQVIAWREVGACAIALSALHTTMHVPSPDGTRSRNFSFEGRYLHIRALVCQNDSEIFAAYDLFGYRGEAQSMQWELVPYDWAPLDIGQAYDKSREAPNA